MADAYYKIGNRLPVIRQQLLNGDGTPANITGATGILFKLHPENEAAPYKVNAAATIIDAPTGVVEYAPGANDMDTLGLYYLEWDVQFGSLTETFPDTTQRFWCELA